MADCRFDGFEARHTNKSKDFKKNDTRSSKTSEFFRLIAKEPAQK